MAHVFLWEKIGYKKGTFKGKSKSLGKEFPDGHLRHFFVVLLDASGEKYLFQFLFQDIFFYEAEESEKMKFSWFYKFGS